MIFIVNRRYKEAKYDVLARRRYKVLTREQARKEYPFPVLGLRFYCVEFEAVLTYWNAWIYTDKNGHSITIKL